MEYWGIKKIKKTLAVKEPYISRDARFCVCWRPAQPAKQGMSSVPEKFINRNRLWG
jgi:hypothetical protein